MQLWDAEHNQPRHERSVPHDVRRPRAKRKPRDIVEVQRVVLRHAAARDAGITYSRFIEGLKAANVDVNRKVLADLAATDSAAFGELINTAKGALEAKGY